MEFYRAEILMENLKQFNEEEEGKRKKEESEYNRPNMNVDTNRMMRDAQRNLPSMSSIPTPKLPSNFKL
jgi:hypothetical protein